MRNSVIFGVLITVCMLAAACGGGDDSPTTADVPATTNPAAATIPPSIPGQNEAGRCNFWTGFLDILPDATCDGAMETVRTVLADFPDHAEDNESAVQLFISRICTGANSSDDKMTYIPGDLHIPALADALVGVVCPGERANIAEKS